ncbi:hypothetical protein LINPERHAP1_LOCUS5118 [Linum perenne]
MSCCWIIELCFMPAIHLILLGRFLLPFASS